MNKFTSFDMNIKERKLSGMLSWSLPLKRVPGSSIYISICCMKMYQRILRSDYGYTEVPLFYNPLFLDLFDYKITRFHPKLSYWLLRSLYFKTRYNIRPLFHGLMNSLKIEGPLYVSISVGLLNYLCDLQALLRITAARYNMQKWQSGYTLGLPNLCTLLAFVTR